MKTFEVSILRNEMPTTIQVQGENEDTVAVELINQGTTILGRIREVAEPVAEDVAESDEVAELIAELVEDAAKVSKSDAIRNVLNDAKESGEIFEDVADLVADFITDCADEIDDADDVDDLNDIFSDWNANQEIIYYYNAWNVIKKFVESHNDFDFSEIKDALCEYGYEDINSIGSELIATILTQKENANAFAELVALIEDTDIFE